jgi:hypothetical protein
MKEVDKQLCKDCKLDVKDIEKGDLGFALQGSSLAHPIPHDPTISHLLPDIQRFVCY